MKPSHSPNWYDVMSVPQNIIQYIPYECLRHCDCGSPDLYNLLNVFSIVIGMYSSCAPHCHMNPFLVSKYYFLVSEEYCHADSGICIVNVSLVSQATLRSIHLDTIYGP